MKNEAEKKGPEVKPEKKPRAAKKEPADVARSAAADKKPSWVYNRLSRGRRKLRRIYGGKWSGCHGEK